MAGRKLLSSLSGLALLVGSSAGVAQTPNKPAAEVLFERGRELLSEQRVAEACAKFEASQEIDAGIGTLLYLGDCYERLGRTASAWASFKEAASLAQARSDDRERVASIRASALEPRLTRLSLRVPQAYRLQELSIRVARTPIPRASWGVGLPVDPGLQGIEATAPGYEPWYRSVRLGGGGLVVVDVPLLRRRATPEVASTSGPAPAPGSNPQVEPQAGSAQRTVSLVIGGIGVAAIAAGTVLAVQAQRKNDASLDQCPHDPNVCSSRGKDLRDQALDYAHASTAVFAAGGALAVAAFVVHITSPSPRRAGAPARLAGQSGRRPPPAHLAVGATLDRASGQLRLSGAF